MTCEYGLLSPVMMLCLTDERLFSVLFWAQSFSVEMMERWLARGKEAFDR